MDREFGGTGGGLHSLKGGFTEKATWVQGPEGEDTARRMMETEGMRQHRDRDCREPATRGVETLGMSMAGGDLRARSSRGVGSVLTVLWSE